MKKIFIFVLIVLMVFSFAACRKAQEQAVENMIEGMMEAQSGEDVDVDIDDDGEEINITGDDGEEINIQSDEGGMAWPSDKLPNNVPEVKGVTVVSVMDAGTGVYVVFEGVTEQSAADYESAMTANGWETNFTMDSDGVHTIIASNKDDEMLQFLWDEESGDGEITYGQQ